MVRNIFYLLLLRDKKITTNLSVQTKIFVVGRHL